MDHPEYELQCESISRTIEKVTSIWERANEKSRHMHKAVTAAKEAAERRTADDRKRAIKELRDRSRRTKAQSIWTSSSEQPFNSKGAQRKIKAIKTKKRAKASVYALQSDEQTIVSFVNKDEAPEVGFVAGNNVFSTTDQTLDTDLIDFFARPVRIQTITWNESDVRGTNLLTFNPWSLWANNTFVKKKLDNYSWFRGDLNIRVQMTASPFYYGLLKMVYRPLQNFKPSTIRIATGNQHLISFSQQPHIDLMPGEHDSWSFKCPFILPRNWVNIQSATDISDLGEFRTYVYNQLKSANGVTGVGITIQIFAWVDNVEMSGASVGFAMQSEDEYGEGPVSKPASWVASAASYLEDIPVIGPFATATRIGATAISTIASMFGFTNVPVIADTVPQRPEPFPKLSTSEVGFPVEKLTLDPKNELSVDPRIVGLSSGVDEMSISYICGRESYIGVASWSTSALPDTMLFYSLVNPNFFDTDDTNYAIYPTPMCHVAKCFKDWRGSIIFRFQIVASKYHLGKAIIQFDPTGYSSQNIGNTTSISNVVHTAIVDLGVTKNVEFEVPYQQALQFCILRNVLTTANKNFAFNTAMTYGYNPEFDNGYITLRVLNALTNLDDASGVEINIYVRAGKDIEMANPAPIDESARFSYFQPQSEEMVIGEEADNLTLASTRHCPDNQYLVHYGENIRSVRQLLHRYEYSSSEMIKVSDTGTDKYNYFLKYFYKLPRAPGYQNDSLVTAGKILGVGSYGYNFVNMTKLTWMMNCYLCYRGGINWTFDVADSECPLQNLKVYKDNTGSNSARVTSAAIAVDTDSKRNAIVYSCQNSGAAGSALIDQRTNAGLNVLCPNMSRYKFQTTNLATGNVASTLDGSDLDAFVLQGYFPFPSSTTTSPVIIHTYNATGVDFGLYFYINAPTLYYYSAKPAAS